MYLGLFLIPWMLMYAASTFVMNHREWVRSFYPNTGSTRSIERDLDYRREFGAEVTPVDIGREVLRDLGLEGAHRVSGGTGGARLVIDRQGAVAPRRITLDRGNGRLVIERETLSGPALLERLHRRRGYQHPYALEDAWAFTVDLAAGAMVFWALSGIWLWWELRPARRWGSVCWVSGLVLFGVFLLLL